MPAFKLLLATTALIASCEAFAPSRFGSIHKSTVLFEDKSNFGALTEKASGIVGNLQNIDLSGITDNADQIRDNVFAGELGERGEVYVVVQVFLGLCILGGGIPVVGNLVTFILGPGLLLAGAAIMALSVNDLGAALSPWPVPVSSVDGELKTDGLFAEMRHPIYAGLLYACMGLSITTGSAIRLLLTAVFLYALDVKSDFEEGELMKKYPEYGAYKEKVTNKFIPETLISILPWTS